MVRAARRSPTALAAVLCASALGAATLVACGKPAEVVPSDAAVDSRVAELEKEVRELREEREAESLSASVTGNEAGDLRRTLAELSDRLRGLETRLSSAPAGTAPAAGGENGGTAPAASTPPPLPPAFTPGPDATFSEEQIAYFRKLQDESDRRRSEEAQADRVKRELARAGVTLTPEQEAAVIRLQQTYAAKIREVFRPGYRTTEAERDAQRAQRDALQSQYEADLRATVPAGDADKIVEAMRRGWPGFFPRRMDGRRAPAGGN